MTRTIIIQALVDFDSKDLAKKRGFKWDRDDKIWYKEIPNYELMEEVREASFPILDRSTGEILDFR